LSAFEVHRITLNFRRKLLISWEKDIAPTTRHLALLARNFILLETHGLKARARGKITQSGGAFGDENIFSGVPILLVIR
jgi:hypothetical protein